MSHYARLITSLVLELPGAQKLRLNEGTQIKRVMCVADGYAFQALVGGRWCPLLTDADLPALTDKGSAARQKRRATLRPGKPRMGATAATRRLVCKVREDQHAHVERCAEQTGLTVSEHVRRALIADGMPE